MSDDMPRRKTIQHFNIEGHAHLLTFSCFQRRPMLQSDSFRAILSFRINRANELHQFQLISFVYMPEHIHLLVYAKRPESRIEKLLYAIKKFSADSIKQEMIRTDDPLLRSLTIVERPGKKTFRFWQEGPGHDRNIISVENCVKAAEYLHNNPVRRRLCATPDLWRWSSWKHYHQKDWSGDPALPRVDGFPA